MRYLFYLTLFFCSISYTQQENTFDAIIGSNESITIQSKKIDSLLQTNLSLQEKKHIYHQFPIWLFRKKEYDLCLSWSEKSIAFFAKKSPNDLNINQDLLFLKGLSFYKIMQFKDAISAYAECHALNNNSSRGARSLSEIARCYKKLGEYLKSDEYYALADKQLNQSNNYKYLVDNALGWGDLLKIKATKASLKKGIETLLNIKTIAINENVKPNALYQLYRNLGMLHNEIESYDHNKASYYYNQALKISREKQNVKHEAEILFELGNLYIKSNHSEAIQYFNQAVVLNPNDQNLLRTIYHNFGYCNLYQDTDTYYTPTKNKDSIHDAIQYFKKGIAQFTKTPIQFIDAETIENIPDSYNRDVLDQYFSDLGNAYHQLYKLEYNQKHLDTAITLFKTTDVIFDLLSIDSSEKGSKKHWRARANSLYEKAIDAAYQKKETADFFYFMEKNRAFILHEDLAYLKAKQKNNIPNTVLKKETDLKTAIFILNNKIQQQTKSDSLNKKLLDLKRELRIVQDSIISFSPKYVTHQAKTAISITEIQSKQNPTDVLISYAIFEKTGYILMITKNNVEKIKIETGSDFKEKCKRLLSLLSKPFENQKEKDEFDVLSNTLYRKLFPQSIASALKKHQKLTVIPDNILSTIPFEILLDNDKKYLIHSNEINYLLSASFLKQKSSFKDRESTIHVFAPEYFSDELLTQLPHTFNETKIIDETVNANIYLHKEASKQQFISSLSKARILHIASHVGTNDSIGHWLAFNDTKMNLEELYLAKNNTELLILNACKTNTGKIALGEGIFSVSRAFFTTGTQSVISSLWNVNDKSSALITKNFYSFIKEGQTPSEALRNAKLNYLKNSTLSETSPYYWASFVLTGNSTPIEVTKTNYNFLYLLFGFVLTILLFIKIKARF